MAEYDEEGLAVAAAKILLSLRTRKLTRWPDWILPPSAEELAAAAKRPSAEPEVELPPLPEGWPKRPRGPLRVRESGWSLSLDGLLARLWQPAPAARSAAYSSEEERAWSPSPARVRKAKREPLAAARRPDSASGSGTSTSTSGERARLPRVSVKVGGRKEAFMAAPSPETPFDYAAAARSGASSSGDQGASRSGAPPSSGDEAWSSSPTTKRARTGVHGPAPQDAAVAAAVKVEVSSVT
uniref:Uncharacterized protein n=1 Tax=Avena sativa TaxID=4498 RepID=A0ACD5YBR8_AVESA